MESEASKSFSNSTQEEDKGPSAKKRKLDGDESLFALIQKPKLLYLNPDILEEILPQFSLGRLYSEELKDAENLQKFMSSGIEPFKAALRYFSHASSVELRDDYLTVSVNRFSVKKGKTNTHSIPFGFQYIEKLLEVLSTANKKLSISSHFQYNSQGVKGKRIFANLVRKDLECVYFESWMIPSDYVKFFKAECSFKEVETYLCNVQQPSFVDVLEMKASKHCVTCHFHSVYYILKKIPKELTFPNVKHLVIDSGCECEFHDSFEFMFTEDAIKKFFDNLVKHFPNLQTLDASFDSMPEETDTIWDTVYTEMKKFTPQSFSALPSHLKGSISFEYGDLFTSFYDVMDELDEDEADIEAVDNYFKEPFEPSKLIKKFDIHDGLTFKYELALHAQMSEESLMELQELGSDSSEEEETGDDGEKEESENEDGEKQNSESENEVITLD